jgi:hypothetical protein
MAVIKRTPAEIKQGCKAYCDAMAGKKGSKEALRVSGFKSHKTPALAWYIDERNPNRVVPLENPPVVGSPEFMVLCAELRSVEGGNLSWGRIACILGHTVHTGVPVGPNENTVRDAFEKATKLSSVGLRSGRGGRFMEKDGVPERRYYLGSHKGLGVEHENPKSLDPEEVAAEADTYRTKLPQAVKRAAKRAAELVKEEAQAE